MPPAIDSRFANAIEAIYAAAPEPARWPHALQAIADLFGDVGANLIYNRDDGSAATIVSQSLQAAHEDYQSGWWQHDIRWAKAIEFAYRSNSGGAITDRHVVTAEQMETHPFYTDFQRRHGLRWIASLEISPEPFVTVALSVHRGPDRPAYSDDELAMFTQVGRHAEQSLRLSVRLLQAEVANVGLSEALSRLNIGVFLLDGSRRVIFSNTAGEKALGGELRLVGGRLSVGSPEQRRLFENALLVAAESFDRQPFRYLPPIAIRRSESARPLVIHILPITSPFHSDLEHFFSRARTVVLIRDSEASEPLEPAVVRDLLGLTLSEARIASLIGTGLAPREAAAKLSISEETARTALKRVFAKVGVSRQSELAALMSRLMLR